MVLQIELVITLVVFLVGIILFWSRFNNSRIYKRIDDLSESMERNEKEMASIKYNYLDRFGGINDKLHEMEIKFLTQFEDIKAIMLTQKGQYDQLQKEHAQIHGRILKGEVI